MGKEGENVLVVFTEKLSIKRRHTSFTIKGPNFGQKFHMFCNNIERVSQIPGFFSKLILIREYATSNGKISENTSFFKLCVYRKQITEPPQ